LSGFFKVKIILADLSYRPELDSGRKVRTPWSNHSG